MSSFVKWILATGFGLAATGQLKSAALKMVEMAADAQRHQLSYGKFSRMLTAPSPIGARHFGQSKDP